MVEAEVEVWWCWRWSVSLLRASSSMLICEGRPRGMRRERGERTEV